MSCLWLCMWSLLYVAMFLLSRASPDAVVSLKCNSTVVAVAGDAVTLNCTIYFLVKPCIGKRYHWNSSTHGSINCNSSLKKYSCEWDNTTYVSLTISDVMEEENFTVNILTDCGRAQSSAIVISIRAEDKTETPFTSYVTATVVCISVITTVLFIFYFLCGTDRGRTIIKLKKKQNTQGDQRGMDSTPDQDTLIA